jgi:Fe2+ transport system protein B
MKRKPDKKAAIQEKVEELSSEGEEEEEEEEEIIRAPPTSKANASALQRKKNSKNKSGGNKRLDEGDEEENARLNKEAQAVARLSNASSMKRSNAKNSQGNHTSMTMEDIIPGKNKLTFKEKLIKWFKSKWFSLFMIFVTMWTMISEDLRQLAPKAIDPLFYVIILLI